MSIGDFGGPWFSGTCFGLFVAKNSFRATGRLATKTRAVVLLYQLVLLELV